MKKYYYRAYPFVRLLIPILIGRLLSFYFLVSFYSIAIYALLFVFTLIFIGFKLEKQYNSRWISGLLINLTLLFCSWSNTDYNLTNHIQYDNLKEYSANVIDVYRSHDQSQTLEILTCEQSLKQNKYFKSLVYYKCNENQKLLMPGDQIVFCSSLQKVQVERNPYTFNYAEYLLSKHILGQFYLDSTSCKLIKSSWSVSKGFYLLRNWCKNKINSVITDEDASSVLIALMLGDKTFIDSDVKLDFSGSGLMHVISISGMHVGVIYMILLFLFSLLKVKGVQKFKLYFILAFLWFYTGLTGMSPSVFRSTIMFSILLIGQVKNKGSYNVYHSLAIAASIILVLSPEAFTNIGFWLSFLAVLSIVYFFPIFNAMLNFKKPWNRALWSLIALSLSAQIGTAPLVIYTFHYFPIWFLLSNLLIVPIVPFILLGGLIIILSPTGSIISVLVSGSIEELTVYMINIAKWINNLYLAKYAGLQLQFIELMMIYIALILFVIRNESKRIFFGITSIAVVLIFLIVNFVSTEFLDPKSAIIVHEIRKKSVVSFVNDESSFCFTNDSISTNIKERSIMPLWRHLKVSTFNLNKDSSSIILPVCFSGLNAIIINGNIDIDCIMSLHDNIDLIIVTNRVSNAIIDEIIYSFIDKKVVFDSSFSRKYSLQLSESYKDDELSLEFISLNGAYSVEL